MVPRVSGAFRPASRAGALASSANAGTAKIRGARPFRSRTMLLLQPFDALTRADHIGQADTELFIHHHNLTVGNQGAIHQHIQWLTRQSVQLNHRALVKLQQVADWNLGVTHFHGDGHWNIEDNVDIRSFPATTHTCVVREFFHRGGTDILPGLIGSLGFGHGGCPFVLTAIRIALFRTAGFLHGSFPLSSQLFVLAELLIVFLVVLSHCVPPSVVSLLWAMSPAHEFSAPAFRLGFPVWPCRSEFHWR